jgi:hypothetical protein
MKFWIVVPKYAENQIKNPTFASPDFVEDWAAYGSGVTIEATGDEQRFGAYSMKVNTASGVVSGAIYTNLTVVNGVTYTFSCYVKGVAGQEMYLIATDGSNSERGDPTTFIATGYWQRVETTFTSGENASDYKVTVLRKALASTAPFYVDGAQFEQNSVATTFFDGYSPGCHWTGAIRNSTSARSANTGLGGELLLINDYARVLSVHGFGMGQWNQVLTKMSSGGDMYQTHIRKSRNISMVLAYTGDNQGDLQTNRDIILDALRPDLLSNLPVREQFGINWGADYRGHEQRIIRYQGFDANGNEATNPVDIVCVFQPSHNDTPSTPVFQKETLTFTVPSGLFQGAYQEGAELDWVADFPAEFIVKRDPNGNWVKWTGTAYKSQITGLNGLVYRLAEAPDGKIYAGGTFTNAGTEANADYLARWNPETEKWEAVYTGISGLIRAMAFDANGDLYIGGDFVNLGSNDGDLIVKITDLEGTPTVSALGTGLNGYCFSIAIAPNGDVYAGGAFTLAGGVANTSKIAKWNGTSWSALSTGLTAPALEGVRSLAFAPNGDLYIGGQFTDAAYPYLCKWDGSAFSAVGTNTDIGASVYSLAFGYNGLLFVGGDFTNAGGNAGADYIAYWNGASWGALGTGTNGIVLSIALNYGTLYAAGNFTTAGGLTLADRVAVYSNGAWQPFDIDLPGTASVYSILPASDGSLYIGGAFTTAGTAGTPNAKCGIVSDRILAIGVASASANTYPFISVTGPGTLKSITNYTTGKSVMFDGLTLQAGEWIGLNFDPLNLKFQGGWDGRGNLMRYVIPGSDYGDFYLKPGSNALSLFMTESTTDSGATIVWNPKFWGIDGALL